MRGITPTDCLRYINRNLGAALQTIELSEDEMMRVVFQESLPTFSKYFPWRVRAVVNCNKDRVPGSRNKFYINDPQLDKVDIVGINKLWLDNVAYYGHSLVSLNQDPFANQLLNDTISAVTTPITWQYYQPNMFELFPYVTGLREILIEVNAIHPTHLKTIGAGYREDFLRLALLDVLVSLYPLRHRYENISTTYGAYNNFILVSYYVNTPIVE